MQLAQHLILPGNPTPGITGSPVPVNISGPVNFPDVAAVISKLLPVMLALAGMILFVYLIMGGYDYLLSGGDPQKMESGKTKITNSIIGFIIVFLSYFLSQLVCFIFGCTLF